MNRRDSLSRQFYWSDACFFIMYHFKERKRKSYAHRIHPRRELRKVVSLAKTPHRYPQSESNWGTLRTSPPSRSLTSCSGRKCTTSLQLIRSGPGNGIGKVASITALWPWQPTWSEVPCFWYLFRNVYLHRHHAKNTPEHRVCKY